MQKHTKIYFDYFGIDYNESGWHDFIVCEICSTEAVDIHHIDGRQNNNIENLIALCRGCHNEAHEHKYTKKVLRHIHNKNLHNK